MPANFASRLLKSCRSLPEGLPSSSSIAESKSSSAGVRRNGRRQKLATQGVSVLDYGLHHGEADFTTVLARHAPADQWRRTRLAAGAEANKSSGVRGRMNSGSQDAKFEISRAR